MEILALDGAFRPQVEAHIREEWAGPVIVTKGVAHDTRGMPGLVAVEAGELLGGLLYREDGDACEIMALFSLRENRGVGTALLDRMKAACPRLWLITTNDNTRAIRFYQRYGFALAAVHLNAMDETRRLKPGVPERGIDDIPLAHEFEFALRP